MDAGKRMQALPQACVGYKQGVACLPVHSAMQGLLRCSLASTKRVILKSLRAVVCMWGHLCAAECSGAQDWWLLQHLQGVQLRCLCRRGRCLHSRAIEEAADDSGCQGQLQAAC